MNNNLPNFLIVGAPKAATTSLYYYLKKHPQIFLSSNKEPHFLSFAEERFNDKHGVTPSIITNFEQYKKLFKNAKKYKIIGEASTYYLYLYKKTINNIYKYLDDPKKIKIIIMLRNPVDRAYSQYIFNFKNGKENLSFEDALKYEPKKILNNESFGYHYLNAGYYYEQAKKYLENFSNVKIFLFEDFVNEPRKIVKQTFNFLGVDRNFSPNLKRIYNISGTPKIKLINNLTFGDYKLKKVLESVLPKQLRTELTRIVAKYNFRKTPMNNNTRKYIQNIYRKDIQKLEKLINRDLSEWLK